MAINYTPHTANKRNDTDTTKVGPKEHLTWGHEDCPEVQVPHYQFILKRYTNTHGTNLDRHTSPHKYCINCRYLGNKLTHPTYINGTDGRMQTHKGEI